MMLTPRQLDAYLEFSNKLDADALMVAAVAAQGDGKTIEKTRQAILGSNHGREI